MAKFIFRLENILKIKLKLEDQAKAEYGMEIAKLHQEEEKYQQMQQRKDNLQEQLKQEISSKLNLLEIRTLEQAIENVKYNMQLQMIVIENQRIQVEKARKVLDEAMKERKTYEKLKENAFEEFKKEINETEQKEVDQLVSFRFGKEKESED